MISANVRIIQNLVDENEELLNKIENIKQQLKDGKLEMEKTTSDYLKLKVLFCNGHTLT